MTTTIHLRVDETTKEKYYQLFYSERSKNTKLDHDEFMLKLLECYEKNQQYKKKMKFIDLPEPDKNGMIKLVHRHV